MNFEESFREIKGWIKVSAASASEKQKESEARRGVLVDLH
jgi:hypothetical protein